MFAGFPETTDACVDAYSVNPCACRAFTSELCEGLPQVYQCLLIEILEVFGITGIHIAYLGENRPILLYQGFELFFSVRRILYMHRVGLRG